MANWLTGQSIHSLVANMHSALFETADTRKLFWWWTKNESKMEIYLDRRRQYMHNHSSIPNIRLEVFITRSNRFSQRRAARCVKNAPPLLCGAVDLYTLRDLFALCSQRWQKYGKSEWRTHGALLFFIIVCCVCALALLSFEGLFYEIVKFNCCV